MKTTGCATTKYVYGNGLIGEETNGRFKTYHFDYRGSIVAITDTCGNVTDTFEYDTYGKLTGRTGTSEVIFGYNGRDGVITDDNGLIYMRARYYSPDMKRFINADVVAGDIANAVTLNRYAYANGNPVSYVDPLGLSADDKDDYGEELSVTVRLQLENFADEYYVGKTTLDALVNPDTLEAFYEFWKNGILNAPRPNNIGKGLWEKIVKADLKGLDEALGMNSQIAKIIGKYSKYSFLIDAGVGFAENIQNGTDARRIVTDTFVDMGVSAGSSWVAGATGAGVVTCITKLGTAAGTTIAPGVGTLIGAGVGAVAGVIIYGVTEVVEIDGKSIVDWTKEGVDWVVDEIVGWF